MTALLLIAAISLAQGSPQEPVRSTGVRITGEQLLEYFQSKHELRIICPDVPEERLLELSPIAYSDLNDDGQEEAVVKGRSCLAGTGGNDILGVFTRTPSGSIEELPLSQERTFEGRDVYQGFGGHTDLQVQNGKLVTVFPLYRPGEPNCCPTGGIRRLTYTWNGSLFVISDVQDERKD